MAIKTDKVSYCYIMRLLIDYPWYFVLFCVLLGAVYSIVLYFWDEGRLRHVGTFERKTTWVLASLRFFVVFLVSLLLLGPLAKMTLSQKEKPIVLVAQDNSSSLMLCKDSAYYRGDYAQTMEAMLDELRKDYDVQCFTYGSGVGNGEVLDYGEHSTDMASVLEELSERFANRNVGALIVTGDGNFNQGMNPVTKGGEILFPIYTVAMGDTSVRKDAAIANVKYNSVAYLGNQFPLEIAVSATRLKGYERQLTVTHNGKQIFSKTIGFGSDDVFATEMVMVDADKPGLQNYTISIAPVDGEVTLKNNSRVVPIDVIDGRQKIAIVAAAPHPDVSALRQALEGNQNYEVGCFVAKDFGEDVNQYDLVVLHQLPAKGDNSAVVSNVQKVHVPTVFVIGGLTDLARLNSLHAGLEVFAKIDKQNETAPLFNQNFSNFTLTEDLWRKIEQFPPLVAPFGDYKMSGTTQALFTARVGSVSTGIPLMAFSQQQDVRSAFVAGEGLWKWRLADYQMNGSHEVFDELVNKMVTFTSLRISKDRFHVTAQKVYREGSPVELGAELYNDNFEPVNTPEVVLSLTKDGGKAEVYHLNRSGSNYELGLGVLPSGSYRYEATTTLNGQKLTRQGNFLVEELNLEELNLVADHSLLQTLAQNSGGEMVMASELERLPQLLKDRDDIKNVMYSHTKYTELLNVPWLLVLLMLLVGSEWVLRKYNGEV